MRTFADLLCQHVETSKMKQVSIASSAGITYNYLHLLLAQKRRPSDQVVQSLAEALHLSPEQTGELLAAAGYAPPLALLSTTIASNQDQHTPSSKKDSPASRFAHRCYRLAGEIPETLQKAFLEEMGYLLDYARYKYILSGGANLTDLRFTTSTLEKDKTRVPPDMYSLDLLATLVGELYGEDEKNEPERSRPSGQPAHVEDMLTAIDQITGSILSGELSSLKETYPHLVEQIKSVLHQGVPWEIRRRITEALPGLCTIDAEGAYELMRMLRLDRDERYGVDIRRRVIESLMSLFDVNSSSLSNILMLLQPQPGDDIYVALATMESCGDIQTKIKHMQKKGSHTESSLATLLSPEQTELLKLQRHLLVNWEGSDLECLQFSLALYDLLCAPDAMLLSLQEGLQSSEKRMQLVAVRYLERTLQVRPAETLQVYKLVLDQATSRNVRRTVARALPALLRCMNESSLSIRTLVRSIIVSLASDSDIHIRRTVADYAMHLFHIDREFLLTILQYLHQDRDQAIRHRLQPVSLRLAQVWLLWYAETAGLVRTTGRKTTTPFGE